MVFEYNAKLNRVIDGDTVILDVDCGFHIKLKETFRLLGVNTPEIFGVKKESEEYQNGMKAKEFVEGFLKGKSLIVKTHKDRRGKYGRFLADIYVGEESLCKALLDGGLAEKYE